MHRIRCAVAVVGVLAGLALPVAVPAIAAGPTAQASGDSTVPPPVVLEVHREAGTSRTVIVHGGYLGQVDRIYVGGKAATQLKILSTTAVRAVAAAGTANAGLVVRNPGGVSDRVILSGYHYVAVPDVTSVDHPVTRTDASGARVLTTTVEGANFRQLRSVTLGGQRLQFHIMRGSRLLITSPVTVGPGVYHLRVTSEYATSKPVRDDQVVVTEPAPVRLDDPVRPDLAGGTIVGVSCADDDWCVAVDGHSASVGVAGVWTRPEPITMQNLVGISCASRTFCLATTSVGAVFRFDGTSWTDDSPADRSASAAVECPTTTWCLLLASDRTARTLVRGEWTGPVTVPASQVRSVACGAPHDCVVVAGESDVAELDGRTWHSVEVPYGPLLDVVACSGPTWCIAGSSYGVGAVRDTAGWQLSSSGPPSQLSGLECASPTTCIAWRDYQNQIMTFDGGPSWHSHPTADGAPPAAGGCAVTRCTIADSIGRLRTVEGDSVSEAAQVFATWPQSDGVSCTDASFCMVVGATGNARPFVDGAWGPIMLAVPSARGHLIACASSTFCLIMSEFGTGARWDGTSWTALPALSTPATLLSLSCPSASFCLLARDDGGVLRWTGTEWVDAIAPSGPVRGIDCVSGDFCLAVGAAGTQRWDGATWTITDSDDAVIRWSCFAPTACLGAQLGLVRYADGGRWAAGRNIFPVPTVPYVSCAHDGGCLAVADGGYGQVRLWRDGRWTDDIGNPAVQDPVVGVSCGAPESCVVLRQWGAQRTVPTG